MNHAFSKKELGNILVTAISDGYLDANFDLLANIDVKECEIIQRNAHQKKLNAVHINTFLVQQQGINILIDAGAGGIKGWGGELVNNLTRLSLKPKDIDAILLTHAHPDHIGGLLTSNGEVVFPNAKLLISQEEYHYLEDEKSFLSASDRIKNNIIFARNVFKQYQDSLCFINKNEVFPNIFAIPMQGHTPGHTGYKIIGSKQSLLIWGDIVHFPYIQLLKPNVSIAFDYDPNLAIETRTQVLNMVCRDNILVGGMHFGPKGFGYIKKSQTGYKIVTDD